MKKSLLYQPLTLAQMEKWREYYNPLRGLTVSLVLAWLQEEQLGIVSNITWLYRFLEERDPTLSALIDRRTSAMERLDWDIVTTPDDELPPGATKKMADAQALTLRTRYGNIDNLRDAVNFVSLASFRRFSHLEKHYDAKGWECHLEPVPQWNWARSGLYGAWWYNQAAQATPGPIPGQEAPGALQAIDPANFIIREVDRPIDVVAVFAILRKAMGQKDWDGWLETFGIPPLFLETPPDMPAEKVAEYQAMAEQVVSDARGVIPSGAKVHTVAPGSGGTESFEKHSRYQDEQIVLKGTGGLLTMLTKSGSGTLAGEAHSDSFDTLAEAEARKISEEFQRQFDATILAEEFPGQPKLAWFELQAKELVETSKVVADVASLAGSGYEVDADQVEEKTGWRVTNRPPVNKTVIRAEQGDTGTPAQVSNRAMSLSPEGVAFMANVRRALASAQVKALQPLRELLEKALQGDEATLKNRMEEVGRKLPDILRQMNLDPETAKVLEDSLSASFFNGLLAELPKIPAKTLRNRRGKGRK